MRLKHLYFDEMSNNLNSIFPDYSVNLGDRNAIDIQIRDQVIDKCLNHNLRRKKLEKGRNLTLEIVQEAAKAFEDAAKQAKAIERKSNAI